MAKKNAVRTIITLVCGECKAYSYHSQKNRRNDPERLKLQKFCMKCRCRQSFTEKR